MDPRVRLGRPSNAGLLVRASGNIVRRSPNGSQKLPCPVAVHSDCQLCLHQRPIQKHSNRNSVDQNLGSDISRAGETFSGSLNKQVALAPNVVISKGSAVEGVVRTAEPTMNYYQPGVLELELHSLESGGKHYRISTSILRLMGKERRRDTITGKQDDRGARQEDATRAATGVVLGGNTSTSRTIPGTDIAVGTSDSVHGMQVIVPKDTKLKFTIISSD